MALQISTYSFVHCNSRSIHLSVSLIIILTFYLISIGTQAYGSIQDTSRCDLSVNQSCTQPSQTESEASQTPLILPDLSPTREDLNHGQTESAKTSDSNDNDDATKSTSTDSDDSGTTENNADDNSDDEQESDDSSDDGKDSGDDGSSMIPFP
jgi:hypothetical protein